jgi:hypothetical protein
MGNDYVDYLETQGEPEIIKKGKWNFSGPVATTIIIIITVILIVFCGLVCYYNWQV